MITIRDAQMRALGEDLYRRFRDSVISGVRAATLARGEVFEEAAADTAVDDALVRAATYGIIERGDLYKLRDLLIALGTDFDTDPDMPWAGSLLRHPEVPPGIKLELIAAKTAELQGKRQDGAGA